MAQYLGDLGCEHIVVRNDERTVAELRALDPRGILVGPGPGERTHPQRAECNAHPAGGTCDDLSSFSAVRDAFCCRALAESACWQVLCSAALLSSMLCAS